MFGHKDQSNVIKMLGKQIADLEVEKETVKRYTDDISSNRTEELQSWLQKTTNFIQTAHILLEHIGQDVKNKWPVGLYLNPMSPSQLRKKAEQICKDIAAHVQEARGFPDIPLSYRQEKVVADRFENFDSRSSVLEDIMEALRSPFISKIGVYGQPGIGKTMLVREVKRRAEQERLFDAVVMATVGRNPDFPRIQGEIALGLGPDPVSNELTSLEASNSDQVRLREKKVLVILDDIWEPELSLELLGINTVEDDSVVSCKILLTSRDKSVVSLLSEKQLEIGMLAENEAWNLFKKIADDPDKSRSLPFYANEITKKCDQLPITVATLANALRRRNLIEWKPTLRKLQSPPSDQAISSQIPQSLHSAIELHYSDLKSNELQQTFLLCSLLGQNATIQNLLKYGLGLGLFPGVKSIEEARAQVLNLVTELRDSSLLLDSGSSSYFDIHNLVRDFATSTASKDHGVLVDAPNNWSDREAMGSIKWIYLLNGDTNRLPDELNCQKLTFFHLSKEGASLASRPNLFRDKEGLKVLSLSKMNFLSIPSSISLPKNLCALCLDQVELEAANIGTMLEELKNLQVLSLVGSDIKQLPKQMGQLAKLKLLDLSDCTQLKVIPPGVLKCLSRLEELYMRNSFDQWAEGIEEHKNQNASLAELKHLKLLTTIEVHVTCNIQKIPEELFSENLARFKAFLGGRWNQWNSSWGSSKLLKLKLDAIISSRHSVRKLLKKTNELHLGGLVGVKNVVNELDEEGFQELKYLFVLDALDIQNIISVEQAFPVLEVLVLRNLENMEKICRGPLGASSFRKLKLITIECCNKLKNLFPSFIARQLQHLQEIRVKDCNDMEEIVDDKKQGSGDDAKEPQARKSEELSSLQSLRLLNLPKLTSFNSSCRTMTFFNEKITFSNLKELHLSSIMVNKTIWYTSMIPCVKNLTRLIIHGCDELEYLFSSSMARGLLRLRHLQVKECKRMRMIIITENEEEKENLIFSQLNFLLIENLQNLIGFYSRNCIVEFPYLKQLQILKCLKLEGFIIKSSASTNFKVDKQLLFNKKVGFSSNLEELQLSLITVNNAIWDTSISSYVEKLTKLIIHGCDKLEYLFSSSIARGLLKLKYLQVKACNGMKIIIITKNKEEKENLIFSQLNFLLIEDLQNLVGLYSENCIVEFPSLKQMRVLNCRKLEGFIVKSPASTNFSENEKFVFSSNLEELQLSSIIVNNTIWHTSMTSCIEKLTKLIIHGCDNLEYLFSSSMARGLLKLKVLQVKECKGMKMIIITKNKEETENLTFSQLNFLSIEDLQNLVGFYSGNYTVEFPSLKQMQVLNCLKLKGFIVKSSASKNGTDDTQSLFNEKVVFSSNLEELQLSSIIVNNTIWYTSMTSCVEKLTKLIVYGCDNLEYLFSSSMARGLSMLRHLQVEECKSMRIIITTENEKEKENLIFSQLNFLLIENLHKLVGFYSGNCIVEFPFLKQLQVLNCLQLEGFVVEYSARKNFIGNAQSFFNKKVRFSNLEGLQLCSIGVNNTICHTSMISWVEKLTKLIIQGCNKLEYLFSSPTAWDSERLFLPKLKRLELGDLPELKSICSRKAVMVCDSLEWIIIWNCYKLRSIPLYLRLLDSGQLSPPPSLKKIIVWPAERWKLLEWDHPKAKDVLLPFNGSYPSFPFELVEGRIKRMEFTGINRENTWLLPSVQELFIDKCNNLRSFNDISTIKDAKELKCCRIWNCKGMECVLSSYVNSLVQRLEVLDLNDLENLDALFEVEAITKSPLPPDTFSSLKRIVVWRCNKIKKLFPFQIYLPSLEQIDIGYCQQMEEIIAWDLEEAEGEKEGVIQLILPKLKRLTLIELPALKSICSWRTAMACNSLQVIWIRNCKDLRRIPLYLLDNGQPSPSPSLKQIVVWPKEWWDSLEWDHPYVKDVLPSCKFSQCPSGTDCL